MRLLTADVEPLWIARYDYEPGWELPLHAHPDYFQVIVVQGGRGELLFGAARVPIGEGQLLFVRPGLPHGLRAAPAAKVRTLDTKFRVRQPALRRACFALAPLHPQLDAHIVSVLERMLDEARSQALLGAEACQVLLTHLLLSLLRKTPAPAEAPVRAVEGQGEAHDLCTRIEQHLREHCGDHVDQRSLSADLQYSYRHLHESWRARHGTSPLRSLWVYRIERAQHLIRYSDYELKRVADLAGFASVHHFTRTFHRIAGVTPAQWRERERAGVRQDVTITPGFVNTALTIQRPVRSGHRPAR
jgi:AraC-like DNA-binding protein